MKLIRESRKRTLTMRAVTNVALRQLTRRSIFPMASPCRQNVFRLIASTVVLASVVFGACRLSGNSSTGATESQRQQLQLEIPQASWEPIFFKRIDELAKVANLSSLRSNVLSGDDREARFWVEAGYFGMDGIVLQKINGKWSGIYLHGFSKQPDFTKYVEPMQTPRSGWDIAWQQLVDAGSLRYPTLHRSSAM